MKKSIFCATVAFLASSMAATALAEEPPSREDMWKMMQDQQREITDLKKRLAEAAEHKPAPVATPAKEPSSSKEGLSGLKLSDRIAIGGTIKINANANNDHDRDFTTPRLKSSDVMVNKAEVVIDGKVNEWVESKVVLLYEEKGPASGKEVTLDAATVTIANPSATPVYMSGGLMTVPFGNFRTLMVTDPLALDLGETKETALQLGFKQSSYSGSIYLFNGDAETTGKSSQLDGLGGSLAYDHSYDFGKVHFGADMISTLEDSDGISDSAIDETSMVRHIPGLSLHGSVGYGPWTVLGEYMTALKSFDTSEMLWNSYGARPWIASSELGYGWNLMGYEGTVAAGYQQTGEAGGLVMPKRRIRGGIKVAVFTNTDLALELAHDIDYETYDSSVVEGGSPRVGTGSTSESATLQLAVGF